jgi:ankyrin repeat protein
MTETIPKLSEGSLHMALVGSFFAVASVAASLAVAQPSDDHVHLADAANWAVSTTNIDLLKSLIQAGVQINEPVEKEAGWTLLHFAASSGPERVVRFLMVNGADPTRRDHGGLRPIDLAYQESRTNICQVLENAQPSTSLIDGFPEGVLETVFRSLQKDSVLVTINGKDPSAELLQWLRRAWPNAVPGSKGELVTDTASNKNRYRNIES